LARRGKCFGVGFTFALRLARIFDFQRATDLLPRAAANAS